MKVNKIYNERCLETMSRMPDNFIDLTVTSPPYDSLRTYNDNIDETWGEHVWKPIIKELYRVTKDGGVVVWVVGDATIDGSETGTSFRQALYFMECGFKLHDTMIYYKNNPMPQTGKRYHQHFEYMFALSKGTPKTFNPITEPTKYQGLANMKNRGKDGTLNYEKVERSTRKKVGNVFFYSIGGGISTKDKIAYEHPAIFPEALAVDQIKTWTNENDIVYDPFMGSGTTAKMAYLSKRNWIGSELSKEYCEIAENRIEPYLRQKTLF